MTDKYTGPLTALIDEADKRDQTHVTIAVHMLREWRGLESRAADLAEKLAAAEEKLAIAENGWMSWKDKAVAAEEKVRKLERALGKGSEPQMQRYDDLLDTWKADRAYHLKLTRLLQCGNSQQEQLEAISKLQHALAAFKRKVREVFMRIHDHDDSEPLMRILDEASRELGLGECPQKSTQFSDKTEVD